MSMYEDDYFEEDMVNAAEMAGHQDSDTTEYVTVSEIKDYWRKLGLDLSRKITTAPNGEVDPESAVEDPVNRPRHYTDHPSGVECIQITEHMNFCLGNATKYIWRAGLKSDDPVEDLLKARWYIDRELSRLGGSDA